MFKLCDANLKDIRHYASIGLRFYVYILFRPNGTPFYVGKGSGRRVFNHERDAKRPDGHHPVLYSIRKIWRNGGYVTRSIYSWHSASETAYNTEAELVAVIGTVEEKTGPLRNLRQGGRGGDGSGLVQWRIANPEKHEIVKQKIRAVKSSEAYRKSVSERMKREVVAHPEHLRRMVELAATPEAIKKGMATIKQMRQEKPEIFAAAREKSAATKRTPEYRAAAAEKTRKWREENPELVAKNLAALREQRRLKKLLKQQRKEI